MRLVEALDACAVPPATAMLEDLLLPLPLPPPGPPLPLLLLLLAPLAVLL